MLTKRRKTNNSRADNNPDYERLGKMLVSIYETGYISRRQFYKMNFIRGVLAGFGGVLGASLLVAIVLWILSLFSDIPLIEWVRTQIQPRT